MKKQIKVALNVPSSQRAPKRLMLQTGAGREIPMVLQVLKMATEQTHTQTAPSSRRLPPPGYPTGGYQKKQNAMPFAPKQVPRLRNEKQDWDMVEDDAQVFDFKIGYDDLVREGEDTYRACFRLETDDYCQYVYEADVDQDFGDFVVDPQSDSSWHSDSSQREGIDYGDEGCFEVAGDASCEREPLEEVNEQLTQRGELSECGEEENENVGLEEWRLAQRRMFSEDVF